MEAWALTPSPSIDALRERGLVKREAEEVSGVDGLSSDDRT